MDLTIDQKRFNEIANEIHSASSPVGIDAKKTHVIILEKLVRIEERLKSLEESIQKNSA